MLLGEVATFYLSDAVNSAAAISVDSISGSYDRRFPEPTPSMVYRPASVVDQNGLVIDKKELLALSQFVYERVIDGIRQQYFDISAANQSGFSENAINLTMEIVTFQNNLLAKTILIDDKPEETSYPYLTRYLESHNKKFTLSPKSVGELRSPCGDMDHPVPASRPGTSFYTVPNPEQTLFYMDFHKTLGYACGNYVEVDCDHDYTSPTWNNGEYGYCEAPRFRMHAATYPSNPSQYSMHGAEPNPELSSYIWPYWDWGVYVKWWHDTF